MRRSQSASLSMIKADSMLLAMIFFQAPTWDMRQPSSPDFFASLSDHPIGRASSGICWSLTASRIVILILVALAASKSSWILSTRSGKASVNTCWNCSHMSAQLLPVQACCMVTDTKGSIKNWIIWFKSPALGRGSTTQQKKGP